MIGAAMGAALINDAGRFLEDRALIREGGELMAEAQRFLRLRDELVLDPWLWPIPAISRECVELARRDELAFYRRLFALGAD